MNGSIINNKNNISFNTNNNISVTNLTDAELSDIYSESVLHILDEPFELQIDRSKLRQDEEFLGFDNNTGDTWVYPKNFPIRAYQYNISKVALFRNTLVSLPTGLGKTFIAAVVMYNIYRWYPLCKIIFMAPTRPLVAQQIEACYNIMGIPKRDTVELTGKQSKQVRCELWQTKRVIFATPQTVQSDISLNPNFPFKQVRLIVVDEAHKAKGKYAYTEVIQTISNRNRWFRVLALSATPGRQIEDVVEVIRNLQIAHVEIRWENSIDVSPYTFKNNIKTELVPLDQNIRNIKNDFVIIIDKYVRKLINYDVLTGSMGSLNKNSLLIQQKRFRENSIYHQHPNHSDITSNFSTTISLFHALDLLERHGIRNFLTFFEDDTNSTGKKYFLSNDPELKMLVSNLTKQYKHILVDEQQVALPNGLSMASENIYDYGHPKFPILKKCLLDFFSNNNESRAIVFCEYRETVLLVYRMLLNCDPVIRAKFIVGKGSSIGIKNVTEKHQKNVISKFREGVFNTLIATCVAEEGINIGAVDLVICFDTSSRNPTRLIQRMGRTGRQRKGSVVMLVTEGSEFDNLKDILSNKDKTNQKIVRSGEIIKNLFKASTRLVPPEFEPKCLEVFIKNDVEDSIVTENRMETSISVVQKPKTPVKISKTKSKPTGMRDMRQYFQRANLSDNQLNIFSSIQSSSALIVESAKPKMKTRNRQLKNLIDDKKALNRASDLKVCKLKSNFNFQSTLNDKNINDRIKILFLKSNLAYLESKVESLNICEAFGVPENEIDDDCILIEPEIKKLKNEIQILKNLFDYQKYYDFSKNYENFLNYQPKFDTNFNLSFTNMNFVNPITDNIEKLRYELFTKHLRNQLNGTEIENSIMDITQEWKVDFHKSIKKKIVSSPAASTSRVIPTEAFNLTDDFLTLNYFKLYNFDEIFEEDALDNISARPPRRLLFDTEVQILYDDITEIKSPIKPLEEDKNNEREQVTVDEIIKMFESRAKVKKPETKKFDLGDADNIFCSDDEDLFADCDDGIPVQQHKTQEFNFANFENSKDLFETTIATSNDVPSMSHNNIASQADLLTQITPELGINNENLLNMDTQINPDLNPRTNVEPRQDDVLTQFNPVLEMHIKKENLLNLETEIISVCAVQSNSKLREADVLTQINPEMNNEYLFDMETQFNPACITRGSNIFQQQTQPKASNNLLNPETQVNNDCRRRSLTPNDIFHQPTQKFKDRSPSVLFNRRRMNTSNNKNTPIAEFSQIPKSNVRNRKRIMDSSDDSSDKSISKPESPLNIRPVQSRKRMRRCELFDDEAKCNDESENSQEEFTQTQSKFLSSFIDDDLNEYEQNTSVDMHQVYLKSVKSPGRNGKFIMRQPRNTYSNIFSQFPVQDEEYFEKDDSFVIDDNDEVALVDQNRSIQSDDECPLERAERILKEQRQKRKKKKRQIILLSDNSSVSGDSFDNVITIS